MINISNGNFGWETDKLSLKDVNVNILRYRLAMVVGPVASGKSTFCKVLLSEVRVSQGQVIMNSGFSSHRVEYCDRQMPRSKKISSAFPHLIIYDIEKSLKLQYGSLSYPSFKRRRD